MKLEANFKLSFFNIALRQVKRACTQGNRLFYKFKQLPNFAYRRIRTKILRAVFNLLPGKKNPGKRLIFDNDVRVGFIVLQVNIKQGWYCLISEFSSKKASCSVCTMVNSIRRIRRTSSCVL
jgi:hypothetical protein